VVEEKDVLTTVQLTSSDDQQLRFFLAQPVVSPAVKEALGTALALKGKANDTARRSWS
jgi:hypothetical protein